MVTSDAMNQVAEALNSAAAAANQQNKGETNSVLRNRRQAIVPPKLATDASQSESDHLDAGDRENQVQVGQLVDVDDDQDNGDHGRQVAKSQTNEPSSAKQLGVLANEETTVRALRRKRSGGGGNAQADQQAHSVAFAKSSDNGPMNRRFSGGSQTNLPTFYIEPSSDTRTPSGGISDLSRVSGTPEPATTERRPDSQMTNIDSIVSSGSSTNLSLRWVEFFLI